MDTKKILEMVPEKMRDNLMITLFGIFQVPMIFHLRPKVLKMDDVDTQIMIPYRRRSKNHLNSMYFGALAVGADVAAGLAAMKHIVNSGKKISLAFKSMSGDFYKRAEGDTVFSCSQGKEIEEFIQQVIESGERQNLMLDVIATTPSKLGDEPVASFKMELSCKVRS